MNSNLKDGYVKLQNDWYDSLHITNEELTILTLLYRNYIHYQSISLCSLEMLSNCLYINSNSNKKIINSLKYTINSLQEKEFITNLYDLHYNLIEISDITNKNYVFYTELIPPPEEKYFIVKNFEVDKIFESLQGSNLSKFNLFRYFVACRRVVNNDSSFGYLTQGKLKQLVNDSKTIQKYNHLLQDELQLIRYNNNYLTKEKHYCTTFIGIYDDKKSFDKQVEFMVESQGLIYTDKIISNKRRSVTQQINKCSF